MAILGISAFYHDSAAAIIDGDEILAAAQEERFTRKKQDDGFPTNAVQYCLEEAGCSLNDLEAIVFYDKPFLKFERLLETYYGFAPKGLLSFLKAMPVWLKEKMFLKRLLKESLFEIEEYDTKKVPFLFPEHHLSHIASAFYPSKYEEAAILTVDGVGEWTTASIAHGKGNTIEIKKELHFPHSLGLLYSAFTYFLGFKVNSGEYKLMGLAPYGNPNAPQLKTFVEKIKHKLIQIAPDGSIWLDQNYFNYATGLTMVNEHKWETLFGIKRRASESEILQEHCNLGLAVQLVTEEVVLLMAKEAKRLTGAKAICLAGGVALNCVANGKLQEANIFEEVFVQPAAGDAGGALGAALAANYIYFDKKRTGSEASDKLKGSYLGPEYTTSEIEKMIKKYKASAKKFDHFNELSKIVANDIAIEKVVGWFQGRMEFGPRALGNRSIIGDARSEKMQKKMNLKIKYRESFRPFAPSVLEEKVNDYFDVKGESPYMLMVHPIKESLRMPLPENYHDLNLKDKLYCNRSSLPAITHIDFSARIQTVNRATNQRYWELLKAFETKTGSAVLVNTSFNVRGEPIVCSPEDAYKCLMRTEMDILVIGDYYFEKEAQPAWDSSDDWQSQYELD